MKLAKKKIYDSCQRKFIERQRLRRELGDQYQSSDSEEDIDYEHLQVDKDELEIMIRQRLARDNFNAELLQPHPKKQPTTSPLATPPGCGSSGLVEIKQNEEEQEDPMDRKFSAINFLADELQRLYKTNNKQH